LIESVERSVFPLLFGCLHALLIDNLGLQSIALSLLEICYFYARLFALRSKATKNRFKVVMLAFSSLLRIVLILTLYLYESEGNPTIMNLVHYDLVWTYLICWGAESIYDFGVIVAELKDFFKIICKKKKDTTKNKLK
jgi:hypothetical protein